MSTESTESTPPKASALERILAYVSVTLIIAAVAAYITTLIVGMAAGREALAGSLWPIVVWISYVGLPVGFVLLMALLGINFSKRSRERRSDRA